MQKYNSPYEEQQARILRLRKQLDQFTIADGSNFEDAVDAFTSFFIQCYHLRDWLIQRGTDKKKINKEILQDRWLSLCRDIANTQKHQKITQYEPANRFVDYGLGISTPICKYYDPFDQVSRFGIPIWEVGKPTDALQVADNCISSWKKLVSNNPGVSCA